LILVTIIKSLSDLKIKYKYTPFKIINDIGSKVLSTVGVDVDINDIANKVVGLSDQGPSGEQLAAEEEVLL
jgi:hypothetical protein